eukprot:5290798-Amphidinium_carterae.1
MLTHVAKTSLAGRWNRCEVGDLAGWVIVSVPRLDRDIDKVRQEEQGQFTTWKYKHFTCFQHTFVLFAGTGFESQ